MVQEHLVKISKMIITFFISTFFFSVSNATDSIPNFRLQLEKMQRYVEPPPEYDSSGTCYHYTELLKVEINKFSKVVSLNLSDSAPEWLREDIDKQKKRNNIDFNKLDTLAFKAKLRNCTLVFPLILESEDFPCGYANKKRSLDSKYFQFKGKHLKGNVIFGEEIRIIFPTKYRYKSRD